MLKKVHLKLIRKYSKNESLILSLWKEIEFNYSKKNRYYHNLTHLSNLLEELGSVKDNIADFETILFTLFYHDIIYNSLKSDNEEKSTVLAAKRMQQIGVNQSMISKCVDQIKATKSHSVSDNFDTNYFTDADLSVLGSSWNTYQTYYKNVRKEYSIYPTFLYKRGRKKVLKHFLNMDRLYKTKYFFDKLELNAKQNLTKELELLS